MSLSDGEGSVWTEWPASSQETDAVSFSDAPPSGCPQRIPAVGGEGVKKMGLWFTVTHVSNADIQRKMIFDWPLTYHDFGGLGSPTTPGATNYLICGYTYTQAISLESDWKLTGGVVYAFVLYNVVNNLPVAFGQIVPFRCQGCQASRITPPPPPPPPPSGGCELVSTQLIYDPGGFNPEPISCGGGGGIVIGIGNNCEWEPAVIEESLDGGFTWFTIATIEIEVCF